MDLWITTNTTDFKHPVVTEAEQGDRQAKGTAVRERELLVRVLDVRSLTWSVLTPVGDAPPARAGHSVRT